MGSHKIQKDWKARLKSVVPFGLGQAKPKHFRDSCQGRVFRAPSARGKLQIHWPEGHVLLRRGVYDKIGGVPDYTARVRVEKI